MIIKYSIGGSITSVVENDSVQEKEEVEIAPKFNKLAICNNCGVQHLIDGIVCTCECGNVIKFN
jgi:hypothetical protein